MPVVWMTKEKCESIIPFQDYGRLATAGPDNVPYITPVNYVYSDGAVYIHTKFHGRKLDNIRHNPRVCFEVSSNVSLYTSDRACGFSMRYWSILVTGTAAEIRDISTRRMAIDLIMEKYGQGLQFTPATDGDLEKVNVIRITVDEITGKMGVDPE